MTKPCLTIDEFSDKVLRPMVLDGIRKGHYDLVLAEYLIDMQPDDPELVAAILARIPIAMENDKKLMESFGVAGAKIGSKLRIRMPDDYLVSDGPNTRSTS